LCLDQYEIVSFVFVEQIFAEIDANFQVTYVGYINYKISETFFSYNPHVGRDTVFITINSKARLTPSHFL